MQGEMPGFFPGRPGGEHDEPLLDMILERRPIPPGAPPEIHGLARMLAAAAGPAEPGDLAGQAAAHAAFTRLVSPPGASPAALRSARRSLPERPARGRLPLAVALAAAAAGLSSTAAAYAGVLPSPIQHFAHVTIGAPAPPRDLTLHAPAVTSSPVHRHPEPGTSAPARGHSAASSDPVGDKTHSGKAHGHLKGNGAGLGYPSCVPAPVPKQSHGRAVGYSQGRAVGHSRNPAKSGSAQGGPGQAKTACPDGTVPAKAAHARGQ
jgi:hypothetical protein